MTDTDRHPGLKAERRRMAEDVACQDALPRGEALSPEATHQILHELRVHQIELEMQNEELRRAQIELDASQARYFALYELAPVGYVTLSDQGVILEANLTAARLLGAARGALVSQALSRFILKEDQSCYYQHRKRLLDTGEAREWDLRMVRKDRTSFWAHLAAIKVMDVDDAPLCHIVISDITERIFQEQALRKALRDVKTLRGIVPICAWCKKIRDDEGYWNQVEVYVHDHSEAEFTHGICPECKGRLNPGCEQDETNLSEKERGPR